jgi:apolipoprotein N-acyltransferase
MNFFVDLTKSLLSPRALQGFVVGLCIGVFVVLISSNFLYPFLANDSALLAAIGNLIGTALVAWYGVLFAKTVRKKKSAAIAIFFIAGLIGSFLIREVVEQIFGLSPAQQTDNVISYAIAFGITCALAGGFYEAITQSE